MLKKTANLELTKNQQYIINIIASIINLAVTTLISVCLSPYIVENIGVEANGFVSLANNFITYATLVRTALNSMGGRFLMIAYYKNEEEKVEKYYSSLFFADLILAFVLGIIGGLCVWNLEKIINIPSQLIVDVKILFSLLFLNFVISTIISVWSSAAYIKNKLYLDSMTSVLNSIIRIIVIISLFMCLEPSLYFVGIGTLAGALVGYILNYYYKKYLFPDLRAKISSFSWKALWELFSAGVWNSISSLGSMLTTSLDLLVTNLFVGANAMGVLSVAKTIPAFVDSIISAISYVFGPSLFIDYAHGDMKALQKTVFQSSKFISLICSVPLGFLLVYGKSFFTLWQPTQDAELLFILSTITVFGRVFFLGMDSINQIFTVVNKVKQSALITLINGLVSIGITFILVKYTDLGIFAVAGVSVICCFLKNILFIIPNAAKYLGLKWYTFYRTVFISITCCGIVYIIGKIEQLFISGESWLSLMIAGIVLLIVSCSIMFFLLLNKEERKILLKKISKK